ncbi:hypothetical protein [Cohnella pontilimi]|uniref:hypothetical protein n=1 Tax=Cohnella pontilimi TaxID=2564100 RepID=UPI00145EF05E|nr:hypothetical protein [Cohnella pontilimi]
MCRISFSEFRIDTISSSSGVFAGSNRIYKFKHISKSNQAFGSIGGEDSHIMDIVSVLDDRDRMDTGSKDNP